jgi:hypothetical protein
LRVFGGRAISAAKKIGHYTRIFTVYCGSAEAFGAP